MARRKKLQLKKDNRRFAHSAVVGKKINVQVGSPRGGIRM